MTQDPTAAWNTAQARLADFFGPKHHMPVLWYGTHLIHYKGGRYRFHGLSLHEADLVPLVSYTPITSPPHANWVVWTRTLEDFLSTTEHEGETVPRFTVEDR